MDIESLYTTAVGFPPYPYQRRLALTGELPAVLSVPTGVGKTAAAVLAWVFRRRFAGEAIAAQTPRRLVYCLPMRTLVEQTHATVNDWNRKLGLHVPEAGGIACHVLMGGTDDDRWYQHPERDTVLIGTQDMLLSRALNRGYGSSRYLWPIEYALLNNDTLWILDETQLMGPGLATSAQLAGLRAQLGSYGPQHTLWMSATLDPSAIETVDHRLASGEMWASESLSDEDLGSAAIARLVNAAKPCDRAATALSPETKKTYATGLADEVGEAHRPGTLTLVVMNRVQRAQATYQALVKVLAASSSPPEIELIHARFRPADREATQSRALNEASIPDQGRIIVCTQAIEAGVDLSAATLFTELAPWSSLVQRFGRCNRRGLCGTAFSPPAAVRWIDIDTSNPKQAAELSLPYDSTALDRSRVAIQALADVGPQTLATVRVDDPSEPSHVMRRKDFVDLFDTTPELSGHDLDVSRFIRDATDTDVQVYWRAWERKPGDRVPPPMSEENPQNGLIDFPGPQRRELCPVGIGAFRGFLDALRNTDRTKHLAWRWDALEATWVECDRNAARPGQTILLHCAAGGYDAALGWTGDAKENPVAKVELSGRLAPMESMPRENLDGPPLSIAEHLGDVAKACEQLQTALAGVAGLPWDAVLRAAWWHDVGKGHPAFQGGLRKLAEQANLNLSDCELWAKFGRSGRLVYQIPPAGDGEKPTFRPGYRHELASALAWLQQHDGEDFCDVIAYLIAAHHGKVRLSIRSMPNERKPPIAHGASRLFARGIWDGDQLPSVAIGNGDISNAVTLDLRLMQLGDVRDGNGDSRPSWIARALAVRDTYGPICLAYLEMLVRIADWRGSQSREEVAG